MGPKRPMTRMPATDCGQKARREISNKHMPRRCKLDHLSVPRPPDDYAHGQRGPKFIRRTLWPGCRSSSCDVPSTGPACRRRHAQGSHTGGPTTARGSRTEVADEFRQPCALRCTVAQRTAPQQHQRQFRRPSGILQSSGAGSGYKSTSRTSQGTRSAPAQKPNPMRTSKMLTPRRKSQTKDRDRMSTRLGPRPFLQPAQPDGPEKSRQIRQGWATQGWRHAPDWVHSRTREM